MRQFRKALERILTAGWIVAAVVAVSLVSIPPAPAFAQSGFCATWASGVHCGQIETCTDGGFGGFDITGSKTGFGIGITWTCKTRQTTFTWKLSDADWAMLEGTGGTCFACHNPVAGDAT